MSGWDAWNAHVMAVAGIAGGGIYTLDGEARAEQGLTVKPAEVKAIVSGMSGNSLSSLVLSGKKYMLLRSDEDALQARAGSTPVSVYKSNTLLLIGVGSDGASAENLSHGLSKVCDLFKNHNL